MGVTEVEGFEYSKEVTGGPRGTGEQLLEGDNSNIPTKHGQLYKGAVILLVVQSDDPILVL